MQLLERPATPNGHVSTVVLEPTRRRPRWLLPTAAIFVIIAIAASFIIVRSHAAAVAYTTVPVQTGSLAQTVTASGTLNPQNTIAVGTQVSGTISEIDADYNTHVKKGQILAKLDPTTFQAALDQAQATLAQTQAQARASGATASGGPAAVDQAQAQAAAQAATARAAVATAQAAKAATATAQTNVTKAQSALVLAQQTVARDKQLLAQGYIAQNQADTDQANLVAAQTTLDGARAAVNQAQAQAQAAQAQIATANATQLAQADQAAVASATAANQAATHDAGVAAIGIQQAQVKTAKANLANTIITSPVDGTVIARSVSIGQTVAASLQTPTLFTIAQDLSKMELDLAVGEPDIGRVAAGDPVSFSVLAFPNRVFHATVEQVRQNPTTVNNVVTYQAVVLVENPDAALRPGMTANATIQVAHVDGATIVPLAALSYQPPSGATARNRRRATATTNAAPKTGNAASPWGATTASSGGAVTSGGTGRIFVRRAGKLVPVPVKVGLVADTQATVTPLRGTLGATDQVVVGDDAAASAKRGAASTGNPLSGQAARPAAGGRGGPLGGAR
ncbi:MAG TPA: efflux RND transporter periplasmic adaptor subunit [Candidatus Limnocylindria bacterium]|jgi:HlyD family secretion protein|nr:efflux RND transporter periplasmic adaptor subunit [Candidatus Limnocylindria bacterium]